MAVKDLIKIQFHKNADGEYQCPVLHKVFTEFTHIVAVKKTGNVFSYEAIRELNIKSKNWKELLTDEPFTRDDIITIQVSTLTLDAYSAVCPTLQPQLRSYFRFLYVEFKLTLFSCDVSAGP